MGEAVWLLATRERPDEAQLCLDACEDAGMTSRGVVIVDGDADRYRDLRLPGNWRRIDRRRRFGLSHALQYLLNAYPHASSYGWLSDDNRPRTASFDKALERAAGEWGLAYAHDGGWLCGREPGPAQRRCPFCGQHYDDWATSEEAVAAGRVLTAGLCWGGELARTVGWLAFPLSFQAGTDVAWSEIVHPFRLHRYCPEVIVEHLHWRAGKRRQDSLDTDEIAPNFQAHTIPDCERLYEWVGSPHHAAVLERLRAAVDPRQAYLTYQ